MHTYYLLLSHPSGRMTVKKWKSPYKSGLKTKTHFYGSAYHFNTEASLIKMTRTKKAMNKYLRR